MESRDSRRRRRILKLSVTLAVVAFALLLPSTALATAPTVTTDPASSVTSSSAFLNGSVNAHEKPATWHFEYATDADYVASGTYNNTTAETPLAIRVLGAPVPLLLVDSSVSLRVTGLTSGTTYHFRFVATNADGTSAGADRTFTTP